MENTLIGAETGQTGRKNEVEFQKKKRKRDRAMSSKRFETQNVKKIDGKEVENSRGFAIL